MTEAYYVFSELLVILGGTLKSRAKFSAMTTSNQNRYGGRHEE
jgi:hypothetical protein